MYNAEFFKGHAIKVTNNIYYAVWGVRRILKILANGLYLVAKVIDKSIG